MKNKTLRHLSHYIVLLVLMVIGLTVLTFVNQSTFSHTLVLILMALTYFVWGIIHQILDGEISLEIVLEYFLISILGLALVLGVLYYL